MLRFLIILIFLNSCANTAEKFIEGGIKNALGQSDAEKIDSNYRMLITQGATIERLTMMIESHNSHFEARLRSLEEEMGSGYQKLLDYLKQREFRKKREYYERRHTRTQLVPNDTNRNFSLFRTRLNVWHDSRKNPNFTN